MPQHPRWTPVGPSAHDREHKALAWLADQLMHDPGAHLWSNFSFEASTGKIYEVDGLLLCSQGLFIIEIKSWTDATFTFDHNRWWIQKPHRGHFVDNPRSLADLKARCLRGELERHGMRHRTGYIGSAIWLSETSARCTDDSWRNANGVYFHNANNQLRPIGSLLDGSALPNEHRATSSLPNVHELKNALDSAGIASRDTRRRLDNGRYLIKHALDHQPDAAWQDFLVTETSSNTLRRARIFPLDTSARTPEARQARAAAARREYETLNRLTNPGHSSILPAQQFIDDDRGPTIIFPWLTDYEPLDSWLRAHPDLTFEQRRQLTFAIADTLRYTHNKQVYHRALNPRAILVPSGWPDDDQGPPAIRITDWVGAAHTELSQHTNALRIVDDIARLYAAPELLLRPEHATSHVDVYSLGALAFLIFTGRAPAWGNAATPGARTPLRPATFVDTLPDWIDAAIAAATAHDPANRIATVDAWINAIQPPRTDRDPQPGPPARTTSGTDYVDPLAAQPEQFCEGFLIEARVGEGASAIVLSAIPEEGDPETIALKVAKDDNDEALRAEGEAYEQLARANCRRIVPYKGTFTFHRPVPRTAIGLQWLGHACTLHALLHGRPLPVTDARDFGSQLLQGLEELERAGVLHRDIKPANLAIWSGNKQRRELYLFDFSLAGVPTSNTDVGTRAYQDPWVGAAFGRPVHDALVDRWGAAVVLHEMLTGTRPGWGQDGTAAPDPDGSTPLWLNTILMPQAHRDDLAAFFERALHRDDVQRFASAGDMRAAWDQIFTTRHRTDHLDKGDWLHRLSGLMPHRPLRECNLPANLLDYLLTYLEQRSADAGEPADLTAGALATTTNQVYMSAPGSIRAQVRALYEAVRELFLTATTTNDGNLRGRDIIELATDAGRGKFTANEAHNHRRLLGLHEKLGPGDHPWPWPDHAQLASRLDMSAVQFDDYLNTYSNRLWRKKWRSTLLQQALTIVHNSGGVVTDAELAWGLLAHFGSDAKDPREHTLFGRALAHLATLLLDSAPFRAEQPEVSVVLVRGPRGLLITTDPELAGLMPALADELDTLADSTEPVSSTTAAAAIARLSRGTRLSSLTTSRLATCGCHISHKAAVAPTEEIYSIHASHDALLRAIARTLVHRAEISFADLKGVLASRFDQATPLPDYDATDRLLRAAGFNWQSYEQKDDPTTPSATPFTQGQLGLDLQSTDRDTRRGWHINQQRATGAFTSAASSSTRFSTNGSMAGQSLAQAEALALDRSLRTRFDGGGFCVLLTDRTKNIDTLQCVLSSWPTLTRISVEQCWHRFMSNALQRDGLTWADAIAASSQPPTSEARQDFELWTDNRVWEPLLLHLQQQTGDVLYTECGTLPPIHRTTFFGALRDNAGQPGWPRLAWIWVPKIDNQQEAIAIDGQSIVTTTPTQRLTLTRNWRRYAPTTHQGAP